MDEDCLGWRGRDEPLYVYLGYIYFYQLFYFFFPFPHYICSLIFLAQFQGSGVDVPVSC